jgi:diguanylate cyclase (GGDEF)-like protein/PAS domain S-box-containing protein
MVAPPVGEEALRSARRGPLRRLGMQLFLALGRGGMALAAVAAVIGLACSVIVGVTLVQSLGTTQFHEGQDFEARILQLGKANRRLMHALEGPTAGELAGRAEQGVVRAAWHDFEQNLIEVCNTFGAIVPNLDRLGQTCRSGDEARATAGPELLMFDPPARPLASSVLKQLRELRADIEGLTEYVLERTGELENELAQDYRRATLVLAASATGFILAALVLLYLVGRASVQHFSKWQDAALQHARLDSIVGSNGAPILVVDPDLQIVLGNREFYKLRGNANLAGTPAFQLEPDVLARWRKGILSAEALQPVHYTRDLLDKRARKRIFNITATPLAGSDGGLQSIVFVAVDDTERRQAERALIERGRHDRLTGLANRTYFIERAQQAIDDASRSGRGFAMFCLGLDHFKDLNSAMGYAMGDRLLREVAARLKTCAGESGLVARFGADEFALLQTEIDGTADAERFALGLLNALAKPYDIEGDIVRSTASVGIAVHNADPIRPEILLGQADMAMHRAKAKARNGYAFFTDAIDQEVRLRVGLAHDMRQGLARGEFFLLYQPRIEVRSGRVSGVEALVRWRHPTQGVLLPAVFIPIAESSRLIQDIGLWVIREACRQAGCWTQAGLPVEHIAVNVSALQFEMPAELEHGIERALAEAGLAPDRLEIEITESALVDVSREHNDLLQRLRATGITIAIDDFGTGFSSLDYLRRLPVDRIKIAQEFVRDIASGGADATIARIVVLLGHALGLEVVAEGVETAGQLKMLKRWGCREVQGYLFAKPLTAEEVAALLRKGRENERRTLP